MSLSFDCPVISSWSLLLLKPLPRDVGIATQPPIVIVVAHEDVNVPPNEEEDQVDETTMDFIGCLHSYELELGEHRVEALPVITLVS